MEDFNGQKFIVIISTHRLWGKIFLPYIIQNEPGKKYHRLVECLLPFQSDDTLNSLDQAELEVIRILNEYSDRSLFKLYSKDRSVKDFLEKVTPEFIAQNIRPYIERRIRKCFVLLRDEGIPCFLKRPGSSIIHSNDELKVLEEAARPLFRFNRNQENTTYKLEIDIGGIPVGLYRNDIEILCDSPCIIRERDRLIYVGEIDSAKLVPFINREYVIVPKNTEKKYFSGFVRNTIDHFKVEGTGFQIIHPEPKKTANLSIEHTIRGFPVLILKFSYDSIEKTADDTSEYHTVFEQNANDFIFIKYVRDFTWEKECIKTLTDLGFSTLDSISFFLQGGDSGISADIQTLIEAVNRNYSEITGYGFTVRTDKLDHKYNLAPVNIEIITSFSDDWFDLKATVRIGNFEIPFIRLKTNILRGIREYDLPDGTVVILPSEWFSKYRNLFELGSDSGNDIRMHKQHFALLSGILEDHESEGFKKLEKLLIPDQMPVPAKPAGLKCDLRDYQLEGLGWMMWLQSSGLGGCLADDMGLGKTLQTLSLLQLNKESYQVASGSHEKVRERTLFDFQDNKLTSLIIVPASLVFNWENEIKKFIPGMKVYCHTGPQRTRNTAHFDLYDIIISSYHTVRQDIELIKSFKFHYVVLDESQAIKNPDSMIYKSVIQLSSEFRLVLTGTPVENSLTDLWAQYNFINPGLLGSLSWFRREFAQPIEKSGNPEMENRLRLITRPFILRRTKEMVAADLPPVTEQTIYCTMNDEQAKIYEEEKSSVRNLILDTINRPGKNNSAIFVLQGLMKLRQISNHPLMTEEDYTGGSGKFETVLNDIENVVREGHKILVFSSFVRHLKLLSAELEKLGIKYSILTGATTDKETRVNSFQKDLSIKVFLISLKAGGVGLNLTAADYVFILDPWWNPASEMQALSRAHRIGQEKSVFVTRYISRGTLEEKILTLQEKKSSLADSFIRSGNPLNDIDFSNLLSLIE